MSLDLSKLSADPASLSGFTLFEVSKGWQLSFRRDGDSGWSVHIVDETIARRFLDILPTIQLIEKEEPKVFPLRGQMTKLAILDECAFPEVQKEISKPA